MARSRRAAAIAAIACAGFALAATALLGGRPRHELRAAFTAALQIRPGQEVRIAGRTVGSVRSVSLWHGEALVTLAIDDSAWPLPAGTTAQLRFGAAAAYASRYVQLEPGRAGAWPLAEGALLPSSDTITPVEFDQLFSTFDGRTRTNLDRTLAGGAGLLTGHTADLARDLALGGPGTQRLAGLLGDLGVDQTALHTLVSAGAATTAALRARDPELTDLVAHASQTFSVLADNAAALSDTIARLPATMTAARGTLGHLDHSLTTLDTLVSEVKPGAAGLRRTAPALRDLLGELVTVAPAAIDTLRTGRTAFPMLGRFLESARPLLPSVTTALTQLAPMFACLRPYSPEFAGYIETWQGGSYDRIGHFGRADLIETPVSPGTTLTSAQAVAQSNGSLHYAFPRPPGLNAGQPWFQPQCGAGSDALDPTKDPEAGK